MKFLLLSLALLLSCRCWAQAEVEVSRTDDGVIHVSAQVDVPAPPEIVLEVLTDYDHLAAFVPDMTSSRVVSVPGEPLRVEQKGSTSFLLFSFPLEVLFEIDQVSSAELHFHSISGNLHDMVGSYKLQGAGGGTRIQYQTSFRPDFWVPPLISTGIMQREVVHQFEGLLEEIARRNAAHDPVSEGIH